MIGRAAATVALLAAATCATAQQAPRLEAVQDPPDGVTVGQPLTLTLTLLVPTYMPAPPVWPDLQIADAVTRMPATTPRPLTRRIGAETWAGVVHRYQITPQRAADFTLPDAVVGVTYADPETSAPLSLDLPLPQLSFVASVPPGAEGLDPFVSAGSLSLDLQVDGPGPDPKPGASVTLRLVVTAEGTQALLLPPLLPGLAVPQGLRAYPSQPQTEDRADPGGGPGVATRSEAVTLVAETPGDYALPAITLDWWNTASGQVERAATQPLAFTIPAPPGWHPPLTPEEIAARERRKRRTEAAFTALVVVVAAGTWFLGPHLRSWWRGRAGSEPVVFRRLLARVRRGDTAQLRGEIARWAAAAGIADLPEQVWTRLEAMERARWAGPARTPQDGAPSRDPGRALAEALRQTRRSARRGPRATPALPPLNPWAAQAPAPPDIFPPLSRSQNRATMGTSDHRSPP